jgi:hypothetical protein
MYGIELEFDNGSPGAMDDLGSLVDYGWCTRDRSLSEKGIEWKTHPVTYQWIKENDPFTPVINAFKKCGYKSHDTKTCGLHIHMSRSAFYDDNTRRRSFNDVKKITSFVFLFEKFWHDVVIFSRRKHDFSRCDPVNNPVDRWASRYCDLSDSGITYNLVKGKKDQKQGNRYQCVNLTNSDTVEVRIFKGTMKINTIMASIQLCQIFYELTGLPEDLLEGMTWNDVKKYAVDHGYNEFNSYCVERGI